jgi:membrane-associated phospholipid phosphatase
MPPVPVMGLRRRAVTSTLSIMSARARATGPATGDGPVDAATAGPAGPSTRFLAVVGAACLVGLVAVIAWVLADQLRPTGWDEVLHAAGLHHRTAALTTVTVAVSVTSEYIAYVLAAVGTMLVLRPRRPWWFGLAAGLVLLAAEQGVRVAIAALIGRDRPPKADWEMHAAGFSMPSGHTATATCAAALLSLGLAYGVRAAWRYAVMAVLALWVVLEGVGRAYLGVHWPTDVVAGWLLGALFTVLAAALLARMRRPRRT